MERQSLIVWIMIVIVVIGALYFVKIPSYSKLFSDKCSFELNHGLICEEFSANDKDGFVIKIRNSFNTDVEIKEIKINMGDEICTGERKRIADKTITTFFIGKGCHLFPNQRAKGEIFIDYWRDNSKKGPLTGYVDMYVEDVGGTIANENACHDVESEGLCNE